MKLDGAHVTIVGMGRSALGAAALLQARGAIPFVTEGATGTNLAPWREALDRAHVRYELGGHTQRAWERADLIVVSPGVPPSIAPLKAARERDIPVIGELELAARHAGAPILAVTGTNGKTTVTEMIRHMLAETGHDAVLAGNNNTAFSLAVRQNPSPDYFVLEVSSYQLETIESFHPLVGAVLNLTPDHLGRHGDLDGYGAAKARLFMNQAPPHDVAVLNGDDPRVAALPAPEGVRRFMFHPGKSVEDGAGWDGTRLWIDGVPHPMDCPIPGRHNTANAVAAISVLYGAGLDVAACLEALKSFRGVEHRLEPAGSYRGVTFYNDSKSTNVDSLRVALESFDSPVTLIAGGQGKGSSYAPLVPLVRESVSAFIAMGDEGPALARAFGEAVPVTVVADMKAALAEAVSRTAEGGTVLLSPGCASFDQYRNFEERGAHFKGLVENLGMKECIS